MGRFKDRGGQEWLIELDPWLVQQVKDATGVDITVATKSKSWLDILFQERTGKLVTVLSILCQDQIKERGLDDMGFMRLLKNDVLDEASDALQDAIISFCHRSRTAAKLREQMKVSLERREGKLIEKIPELMAKAEKETEVAMTKLLESPDSTSPGSTPESSTSTPPSALGD